MPRNGQLPVGSGDHGDVGIDQNGGGVDPSMRQGQRQLPLRVPRVLLLPSRATTLGSTPAASCPPVHPGGPEGAPGLRELLLASNLTVQALAEGAGLLHGEVTVPSHAADRPRSVSLMYAILDSCTSRMEKAPMTRTTAHPRRGLESLRSLEPPWWRLSPASQSCLGTRSRME